MKIHVKKFQQQGIFEGKFFLEKFIREILK